MRLDKMLALWTVLLVCTSGGSALIPEQLVSFMQILYSSLPVIKKGTDSRVGIGYRFGPLAEAQVLLELGPQRLTQQGALTVISTTEQPGKRHADVDVDVFDNDVDNNRIQGRSLQTGSVAAPSSAGGDWLTRWRAAWGAPLGAPSSQRSGRGLRIVLAAPTSTTATTTTTTTSTLLQQSPQWVRSPRENSRQLSVPRTPSPTKISVLPALHLRNTMAFLSRTPPPVARTTPRSTPYPQQHGILRALRQLWEAGARAGHGR